MRLSNMFIPTLRQDPHEAEAISHRLLLRAGYVRQLASGLYILLPLGWRVILKVNDILREEMDAIGAQEISMPALHPAEIWQKTGRWDVIGDEMFRLKDRAGHDMCLGMTHEEIMTWLASNEIRSYRDLPQMWYQIQTKMRDEARPKSGILRTREFIMKDSYSFDVDEEALDRSYKLHEEAYHKIFARAGLRFYQVESDPGMMGGAQAHEFMAPSPVGEDVVVMCLECGYAANVELARSNSPKFNHEDWKFEEVHTPEKRTVEEVSSFMGLEAGHFIKSLLLMTDSGPILALVRGDQELHEKKAQRVLGNFRPALKEEVVNALGVEAGFIGPHGHKIRIIADLALKDGTYVSGANRKDYHAKGIKAGEHFPDAEWHELHVAKPGDTCANCGETLKAETCIEIGNIFKLGTKYSVPLKANYLDEKGNEKPIVMGSYGIGPARIAAAAVEQSHDKDGIIWPESIAPFDVHMIPLNMTEENTARVAAELYTTLREAGLDILLDDREERAGVKFKDADLIGVPKQVIIGERGLKEGVVEIKDRLTKDTMKVKPEEVLKTLKEWKT